MKKTSAKECNKFLAIQTTPFTYTKKDAETWKSVFKPMKAPKKK